MSDNFEIMEKELLSDNKCGYDKIDDKEKEEIFAFSEGYKEFLNACKTERECTLWAEERAKKFGYKEFGEFETLKPGDKFYIKNTDKSIFLAIMGNKPMTEGTNIVAGHIDSPRLDTKPNPLYEDTGAAYFKTHYYGGVKKYQWLTIPLAIHGTVIKENGEKVNIVVGEKESDPVFYISDILPHLGQAQMEKTASKFVEAEKLNVILGTMPYGDEKISSKTKLGVMKILNDMYGIKEQDFVRADIEIVPAHKARDVGFDRSLIAAYGHDDRVCAYTAFEALMEAETPEKTVICHLVDKEETGSGDMTGMQSTFLQNMIARMCAKSMDNYNDIMLRDALENSKCLSSDVTAAYDSNFPEVFEKNNSAYLNGGVSLMKYSGARGKSGTSEASAEFVAEITKMFKDSGCVWQIAELGKVDVGGGGTVAQFLAVLGISVIDCGVPVLSMHAPYEVVSKFDVYMTYKAYKGFYALS